MSRLRYCLVFLLLLSFQGLNAKPLTAPEVLSNFQDHWKRTKTFEADFEQTVKSKWMGTSDVSRGKIYIVKPDRFRWESTTDGTLQILRGKELTLVQPKAQRGRTLVDIYPDFSKHADPKFLDFLAGRADLKKKYTPKILRNSKGLIEISLTAKTPNTPSYIAEVDQKSYLLLALSYEDESTVTRMAFKEPKTNGKLDETSLFKYSPNVKEDIVVRHK